MIAKGSFRNAEILKDINKLKMKTSKSSDFSPKTLDLLLRKQSIFGQNTNILLKASNRISVSEKVPWEIS